jgi:hypothetical protein
MLRLIAFALGVGASIQAFRNLPPDGLVTYDSAAVVFVVGMLCAFAGGFFMGRPWRSACATASATAVAAA